MATRVSAQRGQRQKEPTPPSTELVIRWPWWLHPAWVFTLLTGSMAVLACVLPAKAYAEWRVPKYLVGDLPLALAILMVTFFLGILIASGMAARGGTTTVAVSAQQRLFLLRAYRWLFALTLLGYVIWFGSAIAQGVSINDLLGVVNREAGAIGSLKENSRPIGGVTTITQFGPVAVAIGVTLRRLGARSTSYRWLFVLAGVRAMFYAERLALIEVLVPLIIVAALTVDPARPRARWVRLAPVIAVPLIWGAFAAFEYTRSWVYYQWTTPLPFTEWVTLRLAGYYTTAFNNSALMVEATKNLHAVPYFTVEGFWNAPIISTVWPHPGQWNSSATEWWAETLRLNANPEFNNTGSLLVTYAEFGIVPAALLWLVLGLLAGALFMRMTKGSLPAMLAVATFFIGLLEMSRFIYWTQGRAFPVLLALIVIALAYPKAQERSRGDHTRA